MPEKPIDSNNPGNDTQSGKPAKSVSHHKQSTQNTRITKGKSQHVVRRDDGWVVMSEGRTVKSGPTSSQREAIERAREIAINQDSEVVIHGRDGRIAGREVFRDHAWELESVEKMPQSYIDTTYYGERPHIRGRRLLVSMIAANAEDNDWSVARLAHEFSLTEEQVLAALLYYKEHRAEIDRQDAEEQALFDEMYERYGKDQGE